ncbi:MAG: HAD family hydrolase [Ruthenibacterium sp.]
MYQAVIFDLDGTLLDTIEDLADAGNHVLSVLGFAPHTVDEFKEMVGNGVPVLVERMLPQTARGGATQQMALQMFLNYYGVHSADKTAPFPDILPMLTTLRKAGLRLGVVSNKEDTLTQSVIEHYFPDTFDAVCGHRIGTPAKPDPTLLLGICAAMGIEKDAVLYVGDSEVDIQTAHNARIISCGVLWGYRTEQALREAGAAMLVRRPRALCEHALAYE